MFASALPRVQQAHLHSPDHKSLNLTSVPLPLERSFRYLAVRGIALLSFFFQQKCFFAPAAHIRHRLSIIPIPLGNELWDAYLISIQHTAVKPRNRSLVLSLLSLCSIGHSNPVDAIRHSYCGLICDLHSKLTYIHAASIKLERMSKEVLRTVSQLIHDISSENQPITSFFPLQQQFENFEQ